MNEQAIDYRALLKRYLAYVVREEGISYVDLAPSSGAGPLSGADIALLRQIGDEVDKERLWDREVRYARPTE